MTDQSVVLVMTSHVVRGRIGARASVFALERLGFPCWFLPTITLPWHPGHGKASRIVAEADDFSAVVEDLKRAPWLSEISAVLTGYMGHVSQVSAVASLIEHLQMQREDLLYCCDPVIGDAAGLYVPEETARAICDDLIPLATAITPNRHEFDWLSGQTHATNEAIVETAQSLPVDKVAVTSVFPIMRNSSAALLWDRQSDGAVLAEHRSFDQVPNGPGDLFAGLLTAQFLQRKTPEKALEAATAGVFDILAQTVKSGADELCLVEEQARLERPMAMVNMRRLMGNAVRKKGVVVKPSPLV